jgi:hypothetical protein
MGDAAENYRRAVAGKPYRPSNGTEGLDFMEAFCDRCKKNADRSCPIIASAFWYLEYDPKYPRELIHDAEGHPTCTAFVRVG